MLFSSMLLTYRNSWTKICIIIIIVIFLFIVFRYENSYDISEPSEQGRVYQFYRRTRDLIEKGQETRNGHFSSVAT